MRLFLSALSLLFSSIAFGGESLIVPVLEVYDGDTIKTRLTLPNPLDVVSIRIKGIDTPEMPAKSYHETGKLGRAKCVKEAELALDAQEYLYNLIKTSGNMLSLRNYEWDKYGGRIDADADVLNLETGTTVDIASHMIQQGFAVPYDGGTKTRDWCS